MCRYPQCHLAACTIPWTADFKLDVPQFEAHIDAILAAGFDHLYIMGTAGEGYALTDAQFDEVAGIFAARTVRPGLHPQVGVISLAMGQMIERIARCHELGVRMFQIALPCWGALDDSELLAFFNQVCGAFPDCRFLHYNLPRAKRVLAGSDYRRIADQVPNLVATKNSSTCYARTADLMRHAPDLQHFFLESNFAFGAPLGECSLICSPAVLFPEESFAFFQAGVDRDVKRLSAMHQFWHELGVGLFEHCEPHIDGAYDKTFAWLKSPEFSTRMLPPYRGLSDAELDHCRHQYEERFAPLPAGAGGTM